MGVARTCSALFAVAIAVASCSRAASTADAGADAADEVVGYPPTGDDGSEGCVPDGYPCGDAGACCSAACTGGVCGTGAACSIGGAPCTNADECCSRVCTAGECVGLTPFSPPQDCVGAGDVCQTGAPCCYGGCVSGYCTYCPYLFATGACDECVAGACCDKLADCFDDPTCKSFLQCIVSCEQNGGSGADCATEPCAAGEDATSIALTPCFTSSCASSCN